MSIFGNRTPEIIKKWNENTWLVLDRGVFYVCKAALPEDMELYRKLVEVNNLYIARVFDVCVVNDRLCVVQEYVQGETLEEYLQEHGVQAESIVCSVALELCQGLKALHQRGIVHRDLTPKNIIVTTDGLVKIIDFGISRVEKVEASTDTEFLGTVGFAAPEQYGFKQTSARTDIYSLGVLMNYMLTLRFPNEELAGGKLQSVIMQCTKMDEADRYRNVDALMEELWVIDKVASQKKTGNTNPKESSRSTAVAIPENTKIRLDHIPGFRHDVWWHKVVAVMYYFSVGMLVLVGPFIGDFGLDGRFLIPIAFTLMYLAPVPILFNLGNWMDKFSKTAGKPRSAQILWQSLIYFACLMIAVVLILII